MTAAGKFRYIFAIAIMALVTIMLVWSPAEAGTKKKTRKSKIRQVLFLDTGLKLTYDSNIIRYSDADLDIYDFNLDPGKFAIKSKDDWIITPRLETRLKGKLLGGRTAWIGLDYDYFHYARNDVRRFQKLGAFGRHYFMRGGYLEIDYQYIPDYYYRNEPYQNSFVEARFSKHFVKFETGFDLKPSLKADVSYIYQRKIFNREVSERDLKINAISLDGIWRASPKFKFWVYYDIEKAGAAGADYADPNIIDVSYDAWDITGGVRFYTGVLGQLRPELVATLQFRQIKFQTLKYGYDDYRFGRKDDNFRFVVGTSLLLPLATRFDIDYNYQQKNASLPDPALEKSLNYKAHSISFGLRRSF